MYTTISADVVSSTSLSKEAMIELNERLKKCLSTLEVCYQGFWGRIVNFNEASKGDEKSEYVLTGTLLSLAIALCLGILVLKMQL